MGQHTRYEFWGKMYPIFVLIAILHQAVLNEKFGKESKLCRCHHTE